jgi:hypothetical protein
MMGHYYVLYIRHLEGIGKKIGLGVFASDFQRSFEEYIFKCMLKPSRE